jgi:guanylate kinase
VLDIDVQGARQIRAAVPDATLIFVLPPDVGIMMARLSGRGTEDPEEIARRLVSALDELRAVAEFDHVVINDDLERCLAAIRAIVEDDVEAPPGAYLEQVEAYRAEIARILEEQHGRPAAGTPRAGTDAARAAATEKKEGR